MSLWLAWRLYGLKRSVKTFQEWVDSNPDFSDSSPIPRFDPEFEELGSNIANSISEIQLSSGIESRQRQFLEALLNEIKDAIVILDQNHEIRFANAAARNLFPSDHGFNSRPFLDVCRDHRIYDTMLLSIEVGAKVSDRIDIRVESERETRTEELTLLVEAEPLSFENGDIMAGSWILMRDITSELETEQIRRDFVANASHELRTPLSIINGYLETMNADDVDLNQPMIRRAVATMEKHGDRIARIVEDMLTISKLEGSSELLNFEPFNLVDSAEEMIRHLQPLIDENEASVKLKTGEQDEWIITGDRFYWDQIFFNLIENALKQNQDPGLKIVITFKTEKGRIRISVIDNGIGIPTADQPLIFKRFYRVQKHHSRHKSKGTGLGLSIVKRSVEAHHGTIEVESVPGVTTNFSISVPMAESTVTSQRNRG